MGMFDTVVIEGLKLPSPSKEVANYLKSNKVQFPNDYQTKDLDSVMNVFKIKEDGQMYTQVLKPTGKKIKHEPFWRNWKDERSFLERLYWKVKERNVLKEEKAEALVDELKPVFLKNKLTNTFSIYNNKEIAGRYVDVEYSISVVDGKVKKVKCLSSSLENEKDAQNRRNESKLWEARFSESIKRRNEFRSKWYYPVLKETYNPFIFFVKLLVQHSCNKLVQWSYRWTGV